MSSQRQIAANRRNARFSTGPRTAGGRRTVSLNALKHGLRSQLTVIPGEDVAEFQRLFDSFVEDANPQSSRDLAAVRQAAQSEWRLRRIAGLESRMFRQAALRTAAPVPHLTPGNLDAFLHQAMAAHAAAQNPAPAQPPEDVIATRLLDGDVKQFAVVVRYETALLRQYREAWNDLDTRPAAEPETEPEPTSADLTDPMPEPESEPPHYTEPSPDALAWQSAAGRYDEASRLSDSPSPATSSGDTPAPSEPADTTATLAEAPINPASPEPPADLCQTKPFPETDSTEDSCHPLSNVRDIADWIGRFSRLTEPGDAEDGPRALDPAA